MNLRDKGISLLELLISITIVAVGLTVILQSLSQGALVTARANSFTEAIFLSQDILQELEYKNDTGTLITPLTEEGTLNNNFRWKYTISDAPEGPSYKQYDYSMSWKQLKRNEEIHVVGYLK